ncbi:Transcriptional regulator containing a DNA-binding HTH domain and an aminotransferase domain (MocR family) and their eukaryotic orthologs [Hahella chejuensis KCTC 2396]|uniref:Transcriptional regulator containing a DNA-binding HTH domain and an aminotransferase domain (MocR family) and their eukaryotic orthologs n=1 Tax=Hahella chejuensis (strain KCTC 2396) TaxID=349521 RepID=Q2SLE5_HAHCH|nr:PLP-dependent aminotransferase family protein [Hahella chejuensis]ABC28529.1 Transcriptional regulator containing a DNA-binding HTH domain and an aminotransferase domain (MocR family) and their eukaryotic orthologs [Hahella chejuensis KCTC 2396]
MSVTPSQDRHEEPPLHASLADPCLNSMTFLNDIAGQYPKAISFAPGRPIEKDFRIEDIDRYLQRYVEHLTQHEHRSEGAVITQLFQYGPSEGHIRALIADMLEKTDGVACRPEDIVVTSGAQEGMILTLRALFADPRDVLLVPQPVYVGIIGAARLLDIRVETFDIHDQGVDISEVESKIQALEAEGNKVKALYINADFCNPTGVSLPLSQRMDLVWLSHTYHFTVLEDNPYGIFGAASAIKPTLASLDRHGRSVAYLGSFSKTLFPGVRMGFVVSRRLAQALTKIKSMLTLNTSPICQAVVGGVLLECKGDLRLHCENRIHFYQNNLKHLLHQLEIAFPKGSTMRSQITWNRPDGGFFLVLKLPFTVTLTQLKASAEQYGVLWTPMEMFYSPPRESNEIRLSFSYLTPEQISEGVSRLRDFIKERLALRTPETAAAS